MNGGDDPKADQSKGQFEDADPSRISVDVTRMTVDDELVQDVDRAGKGRKEKG